MVDLWGRAERSAIIRSAGTRRKYGYLTHLGGEGVDFSLTATASIAALWRSILTKDLSPSAII
jgi:hypothetical protein